MATFNQQGQSVTYQYNADTINFSQAKNQDDFFQTLKQLHSELERAIKEKAITGENAVDADFHVKKAILQAEAATPDKKTLIEHLQSAKELVSNVDGLVATLTAAISKIGALF